MTVRPKSLGLLTLTFAVHVDVLQLVLGTERASTCASDNLRDGTLQPSQTMGDQTARWIG